jgi:hypothetical protein
MPCCPGAWIQTERGHRRLLFEETAQGLGVPKEWKLEPRKLTKSSLSRTTSLFHWEYLTESLLPCTVEPTHQRGTPVLSIDTDSEAVQDPHRTPFEWHPPSLVEGGEWWLDRVAHAKAASQTFPNPDDVFENCLEALRTHRRNYNDEGPDPHHLQLLWWEFPREHWVELREGCCMNFVSRPTPQVNPNANMDSEQTTVAAEFIDELIDLGIVLPNLANSIEVLLNAPLFVVAKEGQVGQWRVIADMLRGGQNSHIAPDPVYLPRVSHIVDLLYTGGFSAVVDASKFFYQFPTHPEDQPYLGLLHPVTDILYYYGGLPMGGGNSPAVAGRFGNSFVLMLKEEVTLCIIPGDPTGQLLVDRLH